MSSFRDRCRLAQQKRMDRVKVVTLPRFSFEKHPDSDPDPPRLDRHHPEARRFAFVAREDLHILVPAPNPFGVQLLEPRFVPPGTRDAITFEAGRMFWLSEHSPILRLVRSACPYHCRPATYWETHPQEG